VGESTVDAWLFQGAYWPTVHTEALIDGPEPTEEQWREIDARLDLLARAERQRHLGAS
jgi:hypothetical protein